jgi:hypothetical protein
MNRPTLRRTILVLSLAIPALAAGCDRHVANGKSTTIAKNTPEARFQRVVDAFRRNIEGQPVGFVVAEGSSRTTMFGTNKVTANLINPATADDHFKAVITVSTQSGYSLRHTKPGEEAEPKKNGQNQDTDPLADPKAKQGVSILEPDLASSPHKEVSSTGPNAIQPGVDIVARRPNVDVRKYELVDDGEHWVLITKTDPKTEQSIEFAFKDALAEQ